MLEYVIRPFQSTTVLGKTVIPSTPQSPTLKATLTWGAKSTLPRPVPKTTTVTCCREESQETDRDTELVEIADPNNPGFSIWVRRSKVLRLDKKEKNDCASDWDQFSGVGLSIAAALDEFAAAMGPTDDTATARCQQQWSLNNNTAAATAPA
jgi:hypothetical protein